MIEVKINGVVKWQVNEYTVVDPQMGIRSISLTVTHPSDNATVPSFVGAYVEYEGERYDIVNSKPTAEKGIDSINYKYNLVFYGQEAELQRRKIRNLATVGVDTFISQGTSFSLYADINQFKQLLENNLKYYFGNKWTINLGSTTSESVMVSVNNMSIWDLLLKTFEYYGLRWNITGNTINIGYTPDVIQHVFDYGYDGGLVKITRTAQSEPTINRLVGVGGSRNVPINYFTNRHSGFPVDPNPISGDVNIKNIMPKVFRDSVIAGTLPYIDYVEDAALVASEGVKEDALEPNEDIYPSIAGVEVAGLGRIDQIIAASVPTADNPDDAGYSPTFDIWVKDIGFDLADNQYTATQDAKISFTSGMLAGYEFVILTTNGVRNVVVDTTKSHDGVSSKYKITLINSSEDFTATGRMLPNSVIKAMPGDSFVIHDIIMPQTYVELAELRVQNWLNEQLDIKKVEKPTYAIELTDTFFEENIAPESDGKTIREKLKSGNKLTINNTKVTDGAQELHINNITIQYGGLLPKYSFVVTDKVSVQGNAIARLTNEIQKTDNSVQATDKKIVKLQQYSDRQWKEIQETITLLGAAIDGFSTGINPITVQTMQALVGNESLQFRFVNSKTAPVAVSHAFNWDDVLKSFTTPSGIIQHMTLGITEISSNHPVSAYKFWDIASYSNNTLVAEKPYYLYSKCSRTTSVAVFLLSDVPIGMYDDANYYYFLTGILNSEDSNGGRSFVSLYGFTEILPGRITTDKIVSSDGLTYFDLLNGVIGGKIRFTSTGGGETNLNEWADGTSQDIQDAQAAANAAALKAQQAIEDAEANVTLINQETAKLQQQIDGEVSNWFYPYTPTLANYPASEWTTNEIKDRHIGDTFTNTAQAPATDAGKSWRFVKNGSTYSWTLIADSDAVKALLKAAEAQATADGKSTTFLIQPTSYKLGDMWVLNADRTVNGTAYKQGEILTATQDSTTFNEAHWLKRVRYTDDTAVNELEIGSRNFWLNSEKIVDIHRVLSFSSRDLTGLIEDGAEMTIQFDIDVPVGYDFRIYKSSTSIIAWGTSSLTQVFAKVLTVGKQTIKATFNFDSTKPYIVLYRNDQAYRRADVINLMLGLGNKVTWTPAPEDVQAEIDDAKQEALSAASDAQSTADSLKNFTDTAFRDGIIDRSESVAIEKYKNSLNEAMAKAEASYNKVYTNTYLEGDAKTSLLNAKINLWGQRDTLLSAINTAIAGGTTTPAQKTAVDNAFSTFNNLMTAFQNALEEANKAIQAKLDALSTEKVENLEIGGRNYYKKGMKPSQPPGTITTSMPEINGFKIEKTTSGGLVRLSNVIADNGYWTVSFVLLASVDGKVRLDITDKKPTYFYFNANEPTYIELTAYNDRYGSVFHFIDFEQLPIGEFLIKNIKVEKGTKATDWTPAPEDVQAEIDSAKQEALSAASDAQSTADSLKNFTDTAFRDGIIDRSESVAIEKYKNSLNEAMAKAEASYNKVYANTYLEGTAKTSLLNAKINLWGQRDTLLSAINTAISGGVTTPAQKTAVDNAFNTFNSLMSAFQNALEEANKAIQVKLDTLSTEKVDNLQIGGRNLFNKSKLVVGYPQGAPVIPSIPINSDYGFQITGTAGTTNTRIRIPDVISETGWWTVSCEVQGNWDNLPFSINIAGMPKKSFTTGLATEWKRVVITSNVTGAENYVEFADIGYIVFKVRRLKLERGTKATDWTPAPEDVDKKISDVDAKAQALEYLKQAIGQDAEVDGALYTLVTLLLKEDMNADVTAGISGIRGAAKNNPALWAGGTYAQAFAFLEFLSKMSAGTAPSSGEYEALAKIVMLHDGAAKIGDFIIEQTGRIVMVDPVTGKPRLVFSVQDIPLISDLVGNYTENGTVNIGSGYVSSDPREVILSGSLNITKNGSTIIFGGNTLYIYISTIFAGAAEVTLTLLRNGTPFSMLGSADIYAGGSGQIEDKSGSFTISPRTLTGVPAGTYTIQLSLLATSNVLEADGSCTSSTLSWNFTQAGIRFFQFGVNGMMAYFSDNHWYFTELGGFDLRGKTNMPGVLLSGSVGLNGGFTSWWGAKKHLSYTATKNSTGRYTVYHSVGHSNYQINATPNTANKSCYIVSKGTDNFVIEWRTIGSSPALSDTEFDFQITGNNY